MWGAAYPLMKLVLEAFPSPTALALRFTLASLCLLPFAWRQLADRRAMGWGAALGCIMLGVYSLLAMGLRNMPSARCAFLMGTTVVFVQAAQILVRRRVVRIEAAGALVSLAGVALLTGSTRSLGSAYDLVVLAAAALSATGLAVVHRATRQPGPPVDALTFYQLATLALGASLGGGLTPSTPWHWQLAPTLALVLCAVFASALAQRLQMLYQHYASQSVAAMIFALKPLFAALFAALIAGEKQEGPALVGGVLMLMAAFFPPYITWRREQQRPQPLPPVPL